MYSTSGSVSGYGGETVLDGRRKQKGIQNKARGNLVQAQLVKEIVEAAIAEANMDHVNPKKKRRIIGGEVRRKQVEKGGAE